MATAPKIFMQSPGSGTPQAQQMAATDIPSGMPGSESDDTGTKQPLRRPAEKERSPACHLGWMA